MKRYWFLRKQNRASCKDGDGRPRCQFASYRALNEDDYTFVLLDTNQTTAPWAHQREAFLSMDDPVRRSPRKDGWQLLLDWTRSDTDRHVDPKVCTTSRTDAASSQVTQLRAWSEARMDVVVPRILMGRDWQAYAPRADTVYAILLGLNRVGHLMHAQDGANFNVVLQPSWDASYNHYAYRNPHGRNLRRLARHTRADSHRKRSCCHRMRLARRTGDNVGAFKVLEGGSSLISKAGT